VEGNEGGGRQVLCKLTVRTRRDGSGSPANTDSDTPAVGSPVVH